MDVRRTSYFTFNASGSQTFNRTAPDTSIENLGTATLTTGKF